MTQSEAIAIIGQSSWDTIQATPDEAGCQTGISQAKTDVLNAQNQSETDTANANSLAYKTRLYLLRNPPPPSLTLQQEKDKKKTSIDGRTQELIFEGFTYDSQVFSMSEKAQTNWVGMYAARAILTYPFDISTKDNGEYSLSDQTDLENFYNTGLSFKKGHIDPGRALKVDVDSKTTIQDVLAVADNR